MKDFLSCCLGLAIVSGATYGWIELMLHLKQDEQWSDADITLLSLLGPGEAAVGLASVIGLGVVIGGVSCLINICGRNEDAERMHLMQDNRRPVSTYSVPV